MLFVLWFKWTPETTSKLMELWKEFKYPDEVKLIGRYLLIGRHISVAIFDAPNEEAILKITYPFREIGVPHIVVSILKKYLQSFHDRQRNMWTRKNLDILQLNESNGNFEFKEFKVTASEKYPDLIEEIRNFKPPYEKARKIQHVYFDRHLFQPLFAQDGATPPIYETIPVGLNDGEKQFIEDLKRYVIENQGKFSEHRKLFVLRNLPKKGIGFFIETVNYYPDFIIWIKTDDMQRIIFADPKGLAHMNKGFEDEKIQLYSQIKSTEAILSRKLSDKGEKQKISLHSYIISKTTARELYPIFHTSLSSTYQQHHILLQEEKEKYIEKLLDEDK